MSAAALAVPPRGDAPLLEVDGLAKHFEVRRGALKLTRLALKAVDGVSFAMRRGETLGLVGESGCGKSTVGKLILRLMEPTAGAIKVDGADVAGARGPALRAFRRQVQMIFQDPFASLNPRLKAATIVSEPLENYGVLSAAERREKVADLLARVGMRPEAGTKYPFEFSGGQRQRLGIARALALSPDIIVADEPVSALDVSVQAQVLNLLGELQKKLGLTLLFIAHDLSVVEYLCDEVVVLYLGRVMERGPSKLVYAAPRHPYTKALLATAPVPDPTRVRTHVPLKGDIPSPIAPPSGCVFRTRCPEAIPACAQTVPPVVEIGGGHHVACIRHDGRT